MVRRLRAQPCRWCGREVADIGLGRRRASEVPAIIAARDRTDWVSIAVSAALMVVVSYVLVGVEASELSDRVYQVRCAAEDVATAIEEGAEGSELRELCDALMKAAKAADGWR